MKFEIKNRWTGTVKFTAEIEADENTCYGKKIALAIKWKTTHDFAANLIRADLTRADLTDADLTDADLTRANLTRANLTRANLTRADLTRANLTRADLTRANLTRANLTDATVPFVPPVENLDGKILAAIDAGGKLKMDWWHTCKTTHCRAGWAITLSPVGKTLESIYGSNVAGALIYSASYPKMKVPDFFASDEDALGDIKARAAQFNSTTK